MVKVYWIQDSRFSWRYSRRIALCATIVTVVAFIGFSTTPSVHPGWPRPINITEVVVEPMTSSQYRVRFDHSRKFAITEFAIVGENWKGTLMKPRNPAPCLATQSSLSFLHHLPLLAQRWQGMISVALVVPGIDFQWTMLYIENMRHCHPHLMANVSFHLVYSVDHPPVLPLDGASLDINDCSDANLDMSNRPRFNASNFLYPQNLLRNVASGACPTDNVVVVDIDMIPSLGLAQQLQAFLQTSEGNCSTCAYVIPAFEVNETAPVPNNKTELLGLVRRNLTRSYRLVAYKVNQGATKVGRWQKHTDGGRVGIAYSLPCFNFGYEPFYLAGGPVPPFDTRFVGYGYTRNTQAYETQLSGFRFFVLSNVFLVQHKMVDSPYASPGRKKQVKDNTKLYHELVKEFSLKYKELKKLPCSSSHH